MGKTAMRNGGNAAREKLRALHLLASERLTGLFREADLIGYGVKANEFEVFCAFWSITCYLRATPSPDSAGVEYFSKSVIAAIVERIAASRDGDADDVFLNGLGGTITDVFVERFAAYREMFRADTGQGATGEGPSFPRLGAGFFVAVLDRPLAEDAPVRSRLDGLLADFLEKSNRFFVG